LTVDYFSEHNIRGAVRVSFLAMVAQEARFATELGSFG
jgi:hypothetical protein